MTPRAQIEELANFIMKNIPGEPSQPEGAVECAIRLLTKAYVACEKIKESEQPIGRKQNH